MEIVDSQVHVWRADTPEHPWPKEHIKPHRDTPFTQEELLAEMDGAGVQRAVLVPPIWQGDSNDYALAAARAHPQRFAVMGRIDTSNPASRELLPRWREPGMLGVRIVPKREPLRSQFAQGEIDWLWAGAEKAAMPIMMLIETDQAGLLATIAQRHPGLKIVLDHLCLPAGRKDEAAFAEFDKVLTLARYPNVAAKASSLPGFTTDAYPFRRLHPYLRRLYDAFGPRRIFWGTDLTHLKCSYREAVGLFGEELSWLSAEDREWIMGRGVREWIGWR